MFAIRSLAEAAAPAQVPREWVWRLDQRPAIEFLGHGLLGLFTAPVVLVLTRRNDRWVRPSLVKLAHDSRLEVEASNRRCDEPTEPKHGSVNTTAITDQVQNLVTAPREQKLIRIQLELELKNVVSGRVVAALVAWTRQIVITGDLPRLVRLRIDPVEVR